MSSPASEADHKPLQYPTFHDLKGQRAIVTACTAGIGREVASALYGQGCHVALLSRNLEKLEALIQELQSGATTATSTADLHMFQVDMNDAVSVNTAVQAAARQLHGLDIIVINTPGHTEATFRARQEGDEVACCVEHFRVNTIATMAAYNAALPYLQCSHQASVVTISSVAAQFVSVQDACFGYSGAKLGIEAWAAGKAVMDGKHGVRVNTVRPGVTVTAVWQAARDVMGAEADEILAETAAQTPMRRNASPQDVATAVLFLASSASSFVTGTTLTVDGGWSLMHPLTVEYTAGSSKKS